MSETDTPLTVYFNPWAGFDDPAFSARQYALSPLADRVRTALDTYPEYQVGPGACYQLGWELSQITPCTQDGTHDWIDVHCVDWEGADLRPALTGYATALETAGLRYEWDTSWPTYPRLRVHADANRSLPTP